MEDGPSVQGKNGLPCNIVDITWHVVFEEPKRKREWWDFFARKGFRHVWAYTYLPSLDAYLGVHTYRGGVQFRTYRGVDLYKAGYKDGMAEAVIKAGGRIYPAVGTQVNLLLPRFAPFTCVEIVRQMLGIRNPLILTPYQLYKYIVKHRLSVFEYKKVLKLESKHGYVFKGP